METKTEKVTIEGLYEAARRAHLGTSFSPEKRAESYVNDYEAQLNEDLENIPESERERYIDNYKKYLFAWLSAKSNCISTMITGGANFPVKRAERANNAEHTKSEEFSEWRDRALKAIAKKIEEAKPEDQKIAERWEKIKRNMESSLANIVAIDNGGGFGARPLFVSSVTGTIQTLAKNADIEMVERSLNLIKEWNEKAYKPVITAKNSIWKLLETCEINREKQVDRQNQQSTETEIYGVRIVRNFEDNRIQLFFPGKPAQEMISKLKKNAFKWAPSVGCWQRQLTQNAIYAADQILTKSVSK